MRDVPSVSSVITYTLQRSIRDWELRFNITENLAGND